MPSAYGDVARRLLRDQALDATYRAVVARTWAGLRMADVAAAVGVSRQTLYNEFGSREGLVAALALRRTEQFLTDVRAHLDAHPAGLDASSDAPSGAQLGAQPGAAGGVAAGISAAVTYVLTTAADDPLLKAVVGAERGEDLLPYLTSRGEPVLRAATAELVSWLTEHAPHADPAAIAFAAETVVRLSVSHLVLPLHPTDVLARRVGELVSRYLEVT